MDRNVRISRALVNHRLWANILNLILLIISSVIFYFVVLYSIFGLCGNYIGSKDRIKEIEDNYLLNIDEKANYDEYEVVIKDFYFNLFSDEICKYYNQTYNKEYSITKIYNVVVLGLPANPSYDNYKTDYYQYVQNSDGSFNTEQIGVIVTGYGDFYERNLHDLFYSKYKKLKYLLEEFDEEYYNLKIEVNANQMYSRIIGFLISFIIFYIIIPLCNKYYQTIFEKKYSLASVNMKNGYLVGKYKIILKNIVMMIIPFIGLIIGNKYSIIILSIGYIFLDQIIMLFSKNNSMIEDILFRIDICSVKESLIFKTKQEEQEYVNSLEYQEISDIGFVQRLQSINEIKVDDKNIEE